MLDKQLYFSLTRRRRFKRLDLYSKRQRTVHEMCKRVIDQAPRETEVVIAFGNASWKQGKEYASSPRRLRFAKYFEQFHHHQRRPPDRSVSKIHVCSVNEFNTSQLCKLPYAVGSRHQCLKEYDLEIANEDRSAMPRPTRWAYKSVSGLQTSEARKELPRFFLDRL
ncbi:uncharacterized protein BJ171DRAFT_474378 [Polychytrium aggregatum]|uniref:uncharacterized protein n=1 Tax=Polychytrium aggregatum TaxID=110093 RepID=UPI0022FE56E9|nr:uncharacterized protein BJ171DRAFT_474378 [Polychytrium aggregatum]KAI9205445.1 hypothetical protein BJ171DRAFT_474378 [Polychytrium aggregatum]